MEVFEPVIENLPLQVEGDIYLLVSAVLIFIIVFFIIAVLIAVWVYREAERRGMSGVLWLLVVMLTSIFGLIVFLIVRKDKRPAYQRPQPYGYPPPQQPGYPAPQQQQQYAPQQPAGNLCKNCGSQLGPGAKFCAGCGQKV